MVMKTILVHMEDDDGQEARLQAAFDLARGFDGHLLCLQVTPYAAYALGDPAMGGYPITALIESIEAGRREQREKIEARLRAEGVNWNWCSQDGDSVDRIAEAARLADVVVMSSGPFAVNGGLRLSVTGSTVIHAPAPVIAVSPESRGIAVTGAALIAWDGSQESAVAMRAAIPMLKLADSVDILTVEEKQIEYTARNAATFLSRHGIVSEVLERGAGGNSVESVIRGVLAERRSAWLVQGGYGHSRLRQTLFGGVTRGLLADAPVPLVMAH
jgi:nucleotide-binding universal stress UspA family protein